MTGHAPCACAPTGRAFGTQACMGSGARQKKRVAHLASGTAFARRRRLGVWATTPSLRLGYGSRFAVLGSRSSQRPAKAVRDLDQESDTSFEELPRRETRAARPVELSHEGPRTRDRETGMSCPRLQARGLSLLIAKPAQTGEDHFTGGNAEGRVRTQGTSAGGCFIPRCSRGDRAERRSFGRPARRRR